MKHKRVSDGSNLGAGIFFETHKKKTSKIDVKIYRKAQRTDKRKKKHICTNESFAGRNTQKMSMNDFEYTR